MSNQAGPQAGMGCPVCGALIQPSFENLLFDRAIQCGACGLRLSVDADKSSTALDELRRYYEATRAARDLKTRSE